jgi:hypothetical protein
VSEPDDRERQPDGPRAGSQPGLDAVEVARERLAAVDEAPLEEHVAIYDDVHRGLQEGLADLDES